MLIMDLDDTSSAITCNCMLGELNAAKLKLGYL
jgi:hypothetical protein